jgi:hypothetical protein
MNMGYWLESATLMCGKGECRHTRLYLFAAEEMDQRYRGGSDVDLVETATAEARALSDQVYHSRLSALRKAVGKASPARRHGIRRVMIRALCADHLAGEPGFSHDFNGLEENP